MPKTAAKPSPGDACTVPSQLCERPGLRTGGWEHPEFHHLPRPWRQQRSSGRAGSARPSPIPPNLTQALTSDPAPCGSPSPALRVILIEVGEQQLAGAGLSALARQVHGCARDGLGPPRRERARLNSGGPREHATLRIYVLSGWSPRSPPLAARGPTAASSRTHSCLCSRAGTSCALARSRPPSRRTAA